MQHLHLKKLAQGSITILIFSFLSSPLGYLMRFLFARVLSIQDYGILYSIIGLFWFFITFNDLGLGYSVSYFVPKFFKKKQYTNVWNAFIYDLVLESVTASVIGLAIIWKADWLAEHYFKVSESQTLLRIFFLYILCNSTNSAIKKIFNGLQQEKFYTSMEFVRLSYTLLLAVISWYLGITSVYWYAFIWCSAYLFLTIIYGFLFIKTNNFLIQKPKFDIELLRTMFKFALPTLFIQSISTMIDYSDTIFLTLFRGVVSVGMYNIIYPIASIPSLLVAPLNLFITPFFSFHIEDKEHKLSDIITIFLKFLPFFAFYFVGFFLIYPTTVVRILFGEKWLSLPAVSLQILSIGFCFQIIGLFFVAVVNGLGKVNERLKASVILAFFSVLVSSVGAYFFDVTGVAISNSLVYFFSAIVFGKIIYEQLPFVIPYSFYLKIIPIFAIILFLTKALWPTITDLPHTIIAGTVYSMMIVSVGYTFFNAEVEKVIKTLFLERKNI